MCKMSPHIVQYIYILACRAHFCHLLGLGQVGHSPMGTSGSTGTLDWGPMWSGSQSTCHPQCPYIPTVPLMPLHPWQPLTPPQPQCPHTSAGPLAPTLPASPNALLTPPNPLLDPWHPLPAPVPPHLCSPLSPYTHHQPQSTSDTPGSPLMHPTPLLVPQALHSLWAPIHPWHPTPPCWPLTPLMPHTPSTSHPMPLMSTTLLLAPQPLHSLPAPNESLTPLPVPWCPLHHLPAPNASHAHYTSAGSSAPTLPTSSQCTPDTPSPLMAPTSPQWPLHLSWPLSPYTPCQAPMHPWHSLPALWHSLHPVSAGI